MEPSDARLILFYTNLHYIDTAADLRSGQRLNFCIIAFPLKFCYNMHSIGSGTGWEYR